MFERLVVQLELVAAEKRHLDPGTQTIYLSL